MVFTAWKDEGNLRKSAVSCDASYPLVHDLRYWVCVSSVFWVCGSILHHMFTFTKIGYYKVKDWLWRHMFVQ